MTSARRYDVVTDRWVIVAPHRKGTPLDVVHATTVTGTRESCPFCPGHEGRTEPTASARAGRGGGWRVRAFQNLFPFVKEASPGGERAASEGDLTAPAHGWHEVVVETDRHDQDLADLEDDHAEDVVSMYRERLARAARSPGARVALWFKNRGPRAGSSLLHAHGQVASLDFVPPEHARRDALAREHHARTGHAPLDDALARELADGARVVESAPHFAVYCPFASHRAFETWVVPRGDHGARPFTELPDALLAPLGALLTRTLRRFLRATRGADYNVLLRSTALEDALAPWARWHLEVLPRHVREAGFELLTGMHTTSALPEESATALRGAL